MPALRHISARAMSASELHVRYLDDDPNLVPFLGMRPRDAASLLRDAPLNARRLVSPAAMSEALQAYARRHDAPEPVLAAAAQVADRETFMIVTGQQPGLFGSIGGKYKCMLLPIASQASVF